MTDHSRSRSSRNDDTVVPLLMGALAVATVGPAVLTAARQWLTPRSAAVSLTIAEWWDRNWWLAAFWAVELVVLVLYLWWFSRRNRRRRLQLQSVTAGLSRVLPSDWDPGRHLQVLRWQGYRPVRLRLLLTPRSPIADHRWRHSVAVALNSVLGRIEPISWPVAPPGSVLAWGVRLPRLEIRVRTDSPPAADLPVDTPYSEFDEPGGRSAELPSRQPPHQR
jgi:hypothetical protein